MAITVIKEGKIPHKEPFELKCQSCKTEFQAEPEDVRSAQLEGTWVSCPLCGLYIFVNHTGTTYEQA